MTSERARSLVDWLLLRAWVEPDHEQPLRVVVKHPHDASGEPVSEDAFADADRAASFVHDWLLNVVRRWEAGERSAPFARWEANEEPEEPTTPDERPAGELN